MTNKLSTLSNIIASPTEAFSTLRRDPTIWLPLLSLTILTTAVWYWYFQTVDFPWLVDRIIAGAPELSVAQRTEMRAQMSPALVMGTTIASSLIWLPFSFLLYATYFFLVGKFLDSDVKFRDWYAFVTWSNLPRIFLVFLMAVQIVASDGRVGLEDLNMASLHYLLRLPAGGPWSGVASNADLFALWTIVVSTLGLRVWTKKNVLICALIAALPSLAVYGIWSLKIALLN